MHPNLVNTRFAYVALSRARNDAMIYSADSAGIEAKLGNDVSKSAALGSTPGLEPASVQPLGITL